MGICTLRIQKGFRRFEFQRDWEFFLKRIDVPIGYGRHLGDQDPFFICPPSVNSDKFTRFCQWKNVELNIHVSIWRVGGHS